MTIDKLAFTNEQWHKLEDKILTTDSVDLVLVFGDIDSVEKHNHYHLLQDFYPDSHILICSTAGNILDTSIDTYCVVATAISFKSAYVRAYSQELREKDSLIKIQNLIDSLQTEDLKHLLIFGPGMEDDSNILEKIQFQEGVTVSGGFAGDNYRFNHTYQQLNNNGSRTKFIVVGLYGSSLQVETSSESGWQEFGSQRVVSKAEKNIIYEIDNQPAIELYRRYLGTRANDLPKSALRFPLSIKDNETSKYRIIRAMMKVNSDSSLSFSTKIKEGSTVKLMKTNVHNTLDSAFIAAKKIRPFNAKPSLTLIVSCCARRNVLKQFSEEELEIIQDILTPSTQMIGFYSYGEIAPIHKQYENSLLRNHTITISTIYEK